MAGGFLPPAIIEIKAIADKAIAEFKQVNTELGKMEGQADKASKGVDRMAKASRIATAGLLAAGTAVAGFAAYGVKAALEMENELTKLGQSMANVGMNTAKLKGEMLGSINSMEGLGFAGEDAAAALTGLVQKTGDAEQSQKLLAMSADLARAKGIGLQQASQVLAMGAMGSARAFKQFGITLDSTLPKNEAITKAMDELQQKIGGQAQAATQTFGVQVQILKNEFEDIAETVGRTLIPIMTSMIGKFRDALAWAQKNKDVLLVVGKVVLVLATAIAAYNVTVKVTTIIQNTWNKAVLFGKSVLALFTKQQQAANTAMKANPIGLIVTAVMLLAAGFVALWNRSETFRKIMIEVGKVGIKAIAFIIDVVGKLAVGLFKITSGPLKLLLKGLALLGVDAAKDALTGIEKMTDGIGKFFEGAAKKVNSMAGELDKLANKKIKVGIEFKAEEIPGFDAAAGGASGIKGMGDTSKEKAAAAKAKAAKAEEIKKANEEYMALVKGFQKRINDAEKNYAKERENITKEYDERVISLKSEAAIKELKLRNNAEERMTAAKEEAEKRRLKIEANYGEKTRAIYQKYNNDVARLTKKHGEDLAKAAKDNQVKIAQITQAGQEKMRGIIQESMNRLREAFKSGTTFSVGELFKGLVDAGTTSADELLKQMKAKLEGVRKLAQNASMLASLGFSQTFIEQVVSSGPEIGNQLADSLKNASPEALSELRSTYGALEEITSDGMNDLAKAMFERNGFATKELANAYLEAQLDLKKALEEQALAYAETVLEINDLFEEGLAQAAQEREDALAEARKDYEDALKESAQNLADALLVINQDLEDALKELNADLTQALIDAEKDFNDKLTAAKEKLAEIVAEIEAEMKEKFANMTAAVLETKAAVDALIASLAALGSMSGMGGGVGAGVGYGTSDFSDYSSGWTGEQLAANATTLASKTVGDTNITINGVNLVDPQGVAQNVMTLVKYGQTIQVASTDLSGVATTGLAAYRSGIIRTAS